MDILIKGLAFGSILAFAMGPVFFSLIQTSLEKGFHSGIFMAVGISLSDLTYVTLTYIGVSKLANSPEFKYYTGLIGGIILVLFGIVSFFRKPGGRRTEPRKYGPGRGILRPLIKGFLVNGINPFVLIFWLGAMSLATVEYGYSANEVKIFFIIVLITVFSTDIIKSYLANKLKKILNNRLMKIMNSTVGILLIIFGSRLLYLALTNQTLQLAP